MKSQQCKFEVIIGRYVTDTSHLQKWVSGIQCEDQGQSELKQLTNCLCQHPPAPATVSHRARPAWASASTRKY